MISDADSRGEPAVRHQTCGLRTALAGAFAALTVALVAVLCVVIGQAAAGRAEADIGHHLAELAIQMRQRLDRSLFERYSDIRIAAEADAALNPDAAAEPRRRLLAALQHIYRDYAWIGFVTPEGRVSVSTDRESEGMDVSRQLWFRRALDGPFIGGVGDAFALPTNPPTPGESVRFVDMAVPVGPDGRPTAVLAAHLSWTWAREIERSVLESHRGSASVETLILSRDGTVILGPPSIQGQTLPLPGLDAMRPGERGHRVQRGPNGEASLVGFSRTEGYRINPGLGWLVLVRQNLDHAYAPAADLQWQILLWGAAIGLLSVGCGCLMAGWIARPLRAITEAADRLRHGERNVPIPLSSRLREVVTLARSLRALVVGLGDKEQALEALNRSLEHRVEERSQALAQLNADLEARIVERTLALSDANRSLEAEIEERQRTQETLRASNESLAALIESSPMAIIALDPDGDVTLWNRAATEIFGYRPDEVLGRPYPLVPDDGQEEYRQLLRRAVEGEILRDVDVVRRRKDGAMLDIRFSGAPLHDREGTTRGMIYVLEDVTERRSTQRQLAHAQKMEAVGQLTGGLAHDFNNLLAVAIGNLDLLQAHLDRDPAAAELAQAALDACLSGAELTRRLLAFSRRQALQVAVIDLNELIARMTALLRHTVGEGIEIRTVASPDLWPCEADPSQVETALLNLVINARDAMPEGGRLTIETGNKHLDSSYAARNADVAAADYVMLAVTDTGRGMPPDVLQRAFEPFFTTKGADKGTGLGLSMIYGFAKQSGGHVKIYSEEGHGTTVRLYLPRARSQARPASAEPTIDEGRASGKEVILAVEDKTDVRQMVVRQLSGLGYQVLEAENGITALAVLQERPVDLLFTDIVMPGGMTGIELARRARAIHPSLRVLYTSGFAEESVRNGGDFPSNVELLSKPYRKQELARKVRDALHKGC